VLTTTAVFTVLCLGLPGWAGTRRNIHPLTPILIINHPLSVSSIYYSHPCSILLRTQLLYNLPLTINDISLLVSMVPTAWIYSIQFEFWSLQLHHHLRLHSTCHLNSKTYPLTPDFASTLVHPVPVTRYKQPLQINWKVHVACDLNLIVKGEGLIKVTGSHIYWKSGNCLGKSTR